MALYDFMSGFDDLKNNYKNFEEKGRKSLSDLDQEIEEQKGLEKMKALGQKAEEEIKVSDKAPKKDIFGEVLNMFSGKEKTKPNTEPVTSNSDGTINLTDDQRDNPYSGYSEGAGSGPNTNIEKEPKSNFLGTQGENETESILGFGKGAYGALSSTSESEGESIMNGLNLTMSGAKAGMSVAGPVGAAVGGAIGATIGVVDYIGDTKKRSRDVRTRYEDMLLKGETVRKQEQRMRDGEESIANLTELRKNQLNYLN
jgi:hypothetical protein